MPAYHDGVVEEVLDERFFYGQSRDKTRRFIVYQPMERSVNQASLMQSDVEPSTETLIVRSGSLCQIHSIVLRRASW